MRARAALHRVRQSGSALASVARGEQPDSTDLVAHLRGRTDPVVAVLTDGEPTKLLRTIHGASPTAQVHLLDPATDESELHVLMASLGRFDLVVDRSTGVDRGKLLRKLFFHLAPGGLWVVPTTGRRDDSFAQVVGGAVRLGLSPAPAGDATPSDAQRFAASVDSVVVQGGRTGLTSGVLAYAKLREEEVGPYLELQGGESGRVLAERPGAELVARGSWRMSESDNARLPETTYDVPPVFLREYLDVVCAPGQVVTSDNVLLPDSFRHNQRARVSNRYAPDLAPRFAQAPEAGADAEVLEGSHFYLDSEFRGHFGHAMTEQLSRLWAWREAKAQDPGLKLLMHHNKHRGLAQFEVDLFGAAGVHPDDIVFRTDPVRVERLVAATPMFSQPQYVHPDLVDLWSEVGRNLAAQAEGGHPKRIFCARRLKKRACHNAGEVEELFAEHGFTILFSEDHPLAEQAAIFREAEVIAGFAGSALFNLILSDGPKKVVMISSESYVAQNEHMIAAAMGHEVNVAWCRSDVPMPADHWSRKAFHSGFTFDLGREGLFVRDVLGSL